VMVYSVDEVVGIDIESGDRHPYQPLHSFRHHREGSRFFQITRSESAGEQIKTHLRVGGPLNLKRETLSCRITACNGDLPREYLRENAINLPANDAPGFASLANLTRPGRQLNPPRRRDYRLALVSHLSLNYTALGEAETLCGLLRLYDWSGSEQNRLRIEGLRDLRIRPVTRIKRGGVLRGLEITLYLQEESYLNEGDAHLLGMMLHHFLSQFAAVNSFVQTRVILQPSNREMTWEPLFGENLPV